MTNASLAKSYLAKAKVRLTILSVLFDANAYSDVVREPQEIVELCLKGMLREVGIEPPHWHDVGPLIKEYGDRFPAVTAHLDRIVEVSAWLRHEREFSFYGDIDVIPTEHYAESDGVRAIDDTRFVVSVADSVIGVRESAAEEPSDRQSTSGQ